MELSQAPLSKKPAPLVARDAKHCVSNLPCGRRVRFFIRSRVGSRAAELFRNLGRWQHLYPLVFEAESPDFAK